MSDNEQKNDRRETIADIVEEMKNLVAQGETISHTYELMNGLADRIEAAAKREKAEAESDALSVGGVVEAARHRPGNAAAMREALRACFDFIMRLDRAFNPFMQNLLENAIAKAKPALAAPPRNCDVGTAEEQTHRMLLYCKYHGVDENRCFRCEGCPILTADICELSWAQMPYEAQEGGAK